MTPPSTLVEKEKGVAAVTPAAPAPAAAAPRTRPMDDIDRRILAILQDHARTPNAEIARRLDMAPSAILERIRKLEENGVIEGYSARLSPRALGYGVVAFVHVRTSGAGIDGARAFAEIPEVQEVHDVAGDDGWVLKIRSVDAEGLRAVVRERIATAKGVAEVKTLYVLKSAKESSALPIR